VINGIIGGIIGLFISLAFASGNQGIGGAFGGLIGNIILSPIYAAFVLLITSGFYYLLVLLLVRPGNAGFEATFRVVSYASVTWLISWIPIIGWIVAPIYGIVLSIFGIREVHATTTGKAALVVLIPVAIGLVLLVIFAVVLGALFVTLSQQQQQF